MDVSWSNGRVKKINITLGYTGCVTVNMNGEIREVSGTPGEEMSVDV